MIPLYRNRLQPCSQTPLARAGQSPALQTVIEGSKGRAMMGERERERQSTGVSGRVGEGFWREAVYLQVITLQEVMGMHPFPREEQG